VLSFPPPVLPREGELPRESVWKGEVEISSSAVSIILCTLTTTTTMINLSAGQMVPLPQPAAKMRRDIEGLSSSEKLQEPAAAASRVERRLGEKQHANSGTGKRRATLFEEERLSLCSSNYGGKIVLLQRGQGRPNRRKTLPAILLSTSTAPNLNGKTTTSALTASEEPTNAFFAESRCTKIERVD